MADDDFVEGDAHSEAADAPDTETPREAKQGGFDSGSVSDAPVMHRPKSAARMAEARKAFAEAVLANKDKPAAKPAGGDNDILDPDEPAPIAALAVAAKAKLEGANAPPVAAAVPAPAAPPAPSLDPEVRALKESLKSERDAIAKERAELEKQRAPAAAAVTAHASTADDIEAYLDSAPTWLRQRLETMRADKMTDDEFKSEVADLITMLSGDVLGVPLPEIVRTKLEATQAKKMVRTNKVIMSRKEAAAAEKAAADALAANERAENEKVEIGWKNASASLSKHMVDGDPRETDPNKHPAKVYPWLAAEDDPGSVIVDVIRAKLNKDGTQLAWHEAAKVADEYLADNAKRYYDKRKPLLGGGAAPVAAAKAAVPAAAVKPAETPKPAVTVTPSGNQKWNNDKHREQTRAAFRELRAKGD